jgi:hypothetical protein
MTPWDAHAFDKLGISDTSRARPIQAGLASAARFAVGALMPLLVTAIAPEAGLTILVSGSSLALLALLCALAARAGAAGSDDWRNTHDVLGGLGHGDDCRYRMAIWSSCMNEGCALG